MISVLTFLPLVGAGAVLLWGASKPGQPRRLGLGFCALALVWVLIMALRFDGASSELQFVERHAWIPGLGVDYFVAVDGLGMLMLVLAALVVPFALLISRGELENDRLFVALMLALQAGLFGAFTALNFFHWFIFWELSLVPAYFLIKLWGGPRRVHAATQFFVYTLVGSVAMLLGFLAVAGATGSFDFIELAEKGRSGELAALLGEKLAWTQLSTQALAQVVALGVFLGFAVKVPVVPFHTWLPAAYTEAPTGVTMVLTGAMSKMGVYGLLRIFLPIFPEQMRWALDGLLWLAVATVVVGALAALAQTDLKRMLAYSSVNHLGYCLLGIFAVVQATGEETRWTMERAAALDGVLLQMFNHGITAAALFCFVGWIEQRAGGRRGLDDFGGLRKVAPVFCGLMGIALFASLGLPGLNGFVGEFLIFKGAFPLAGWAAALSVLGLLVTAVFLLTVLQRVWNGPLATQWQGFADLTVHERWVVAPAVALMFLIGLCPQLVLNLTNATVQQWATWLGASL